jgi:hypothetical protein
MGNDPLRRPASTPPDLLPQNSQVIVPLVTCPLKQLGFPVSPQFRI